MLLVICPTRGRPQAAKEAWDSFHATKSLPDTGMMFAADSDDETRFQVISAMTLDPPPGCMNVALNQLAFLMLVDRPEVDVVGFVGDDHRFRSKGWDEEILDILSEKPGVAYGNDLFQGERLPTNWFVSRPIVEAFGMGLPTLNHLFIDDYWRDLAGGAECLFYLPEVIIEHMHPHAGKAQWDAGYERVNDPGMYNKDGAAYRAWRDTQMASDIEKLKGIVG